MKNNIRNAAIRLDQWISDHSEITDDSALTSMLALSQLCSMTAGSDTKSAAHLKRLISEAESIDFSSGTLTIGMLSAIFIADHGNDRQKTHAVDYLKLLSGLYNQDSATINTALLKAVFEKRSFEVLPAGIPDIPLYEIDISAMMRRTLTQIEIISVFGTTEISADFIFKTKIEGMAIHAMRVYDLTLAMRCLRALKYIGNDKNLVSRIGIDYILQQQCYDGSFGDFDTALSAIEDPLKNSEIRLAIKLDAAFQIMWTLFEMRGPDYNLMQNLHLQTSEILQQNQNIIYAD